MKNIISDCLKKITKEETISLDFPEQESHGDYSSNIALITAKKENKNPRELASEIVEKLQNDKNLQKVIDKIEVAGPGFINFYLKNDFLINEINKINTEKEDYGKEESKNKTVLVEYSSPNIAKKFSIGHFHSTLIGQSLYNLYKFLGYKVIGENHLGDWGTQFGMIIAAVTRNKLDINKLSVDELEKLYIEFNAEAKDNPEIREEGKIWFKKLEDGDQTARMIWQKAKEVSLSEFKKIYDLVNIQIDNDHGESFYEDKMPQVIKEVREKGLSKKSQGAEIVEFEDLPPAMLIKSDGTTTYFTRDLAAISYRIKTWNPDIFIYEVGAEQKLHFQQVFETAKLLGWSENKKFVHIAHGLFLYEGKKMSTRLGTNINLEEILNKAIGKSKEIIEKKEAIKNLTPIQKDEIIHKIGIGSVKYFELSHHPSSNINFDWESVFALDGNSAPYIQYTIARIGSVISKSKNISQETNLISFNKEEQSIIKTLVKFNEIIELSAFSYSPNLLCNYLYELAQKFNTFYNLHKVIGSDSEAFRLNLTKATGIVLKSGLNLLGIESPEEM